MGNHNSSTIINSNQVKSRNSINYYSVEFLQHDNAYSTSAANFAHTLSSFNQEAFLNEKNLRNGAALVKRSKSYAIPENQVLPCQFISSKPLRALNKFKTDGLKKTWKRENVNHSQEFIHFDENFFVKPSLIRKQMNAKSSSEFSSLFFKSKENNKLKKLDKLKNGVNKTLNRKKNKVSTHAQEISYDEKIFEMIEDIKHFQINNTESRLDDSYFNYSQISLSNSSSFSATCTNTTLLSAEYNFKPDLSRFPRKSNFNKKSKMNPQLEFINEYERLNQDSNFILMPKQPKQLDDILSIKHEMTFSSNFNKLKKPTKPQIKTSFNRTRRKCIDEVFPQINLKSGAENDQDMINKQKSCNMRIASFSSHFNDDLPKRFQSQGSSSSNEYETLNNLQAAQHIYSIEKLNILY